MTDMSSFLQGHQPPQDNVTTFDHSRRVECRALVVRTPGRPPEVPFTREIEERVCHLVAGGMTVRKIGDMKDMPSRSTIRRRIAEDPDFRRAYALAKEGLVEDILEEIKEVADDVTGDFRSEENSEGMPVVTEYKESIARSALRIGTYFKLLAKMAPSKYGDVPPALAPPAPPEQQRDGSGAKVIDGEVIPIERHPLFESVEAWGKVAKETK